MTRRGGSGGAGRVILGGGWSDYAWGCRSAYRGGREPGFRSHDLGFRVSRAAD